MANKFKIYLDDVLQKEIDLKADLASVPAGDHVVKVESYQDTTLVASDTVNVTVPEPVSSYEAETTAYMTASGFPDDSELSIYGISNNQLWVKVDDLVKGLKTESLLSKCTRAYLKLGDTAAKAAIDLVSANETGSYAGGVTFDSSGVAFNGSNGFFDSGVDFNSIGNGAALTITHIEVDAASLSTATSAGIYGGVNDRFQVYVYMNEQDLQIYVGDGSINPSGADNLGVVTGNTDLSTIELFRNGAIQGSDSFGTGNIPAGNCFEGARNSGGNAGNFMNGILGTSVYHEHLSEAETATLHNIIDTFETAINRKTWL